MQNTHRYIYTILVLESGVWGKVSIICNLIEKIEENLQLSSMIVVQYLTIGKEKFNIISKVNNIKFLVI